MKEIVLIYYNEIALKGNNRRWFENLLIKNIKRALEEVEYEKIQLKDARIVIDLCSKSNRKKIVEKLKKVFGISYFCFAYETEKDIEKLKFTVIEYLKNNQVPIPIKVETKRSDKKFKMNSMEISHEIGKEIDQKGFKTDLENPNTLIRISILHKSATVSFEKILGLGGLPVGSSGKVICLLSGGIDSPVAAIQMMKRGCEIDLLHFYQLADSKEVLDSKIGKISEILREYGFDGKIYLAPYSEFYKATFSNLEPRKELILFRRFILRVANKIALRTRAKGVTTGDNLAQVASQTIDNLYATNEASVIPVYRPLLCYDKEEIIELARKYGTFEESIKEYKDCCSIVAVRNPETKTKLDDIKRLEEKIELEQIVKNTINKIEIK